MNPFSIFLIFLRLGCTSFGGPVAHLGYFQQAFVNKRNWLSAQEYAEIVALCQFLPGPASSQVGMAIGHKMAGQKGCFAAWLGFTLPSALLLLLLGLGVYTLGEQFQSVIAGFLVVAVVVVAHAVWGMYQKLCNSWLTRAIALITALILVFFPVPFLHLLLLIAGGLVSVLAISLNKPNAQQTKEKVSFSLSKTSLLWLLGFTVLLIVLPTLTLVSTSSLLALFDTSYRAGALVFGGGHVVLPLLESEVVNPNGLSESTFLTGYGLAQAVPGPLFTFATYIGSVTAGINPILGGIVATIAIFLPGYLLLMACLPVMASIQSHPLLKKALIGVNATVVGILFAAFISPVLMKGITNIPEGIIAVIGFYLLNNKKRPVLECMFVIVTLVMLSKLVI